MVSNRIAVGALSLACIAAAGAGGYLATRHDVTPVAAPAAASIPEPAAPAGASVAGPEASSQPTPLTESQAPQVEAVAGSTTPIADPPAGPPATFHR